MSEMEKKNLITTMIREAIEKKASVKVYITNGYQMTVRILDYSNNAILVEDEAGKKKSLVFTHAISTIDF